MVARACPRVSPSGDPEAGVLPGVWRNSIPEYFFPNTVHSPFGPIITHKPVRPWNASDLKALDCECTQPLDRTGTIATVHGEDTTVHINRLTDRSQPWINPIVRLAGLRDLGCGCNEPAIAYTPSLNTHLS